MKDSAQKDRVIPKDIVLKETFEAGLKYSLYSNFKKWTEAFLELVDNAVSNRILGQKLLVEIYTSKKHLRIVNRGGYGMSPKELQEFLNWGKIKSRSAYDIGAYSQGGKAAMGYLGRAMKITASPTGENTLYMFEDYDLHDFERLKNYPVIQSKTDQVEGFVEVQISELSKNIKTEELESLMVNIYRPLIESGGVDFFHNGEKLKIEAFPLDEDFTIQDFSFPIKYGNKDNKAVSGWIGRLGPRSGVKGGVRCYKLGRLVCDREFFGQPDANNKQTLNFLFGEVYLNHIPATTNKTDFQKDSQEWDEASGEMFKILQPHIEELLGRKIQEPTDEEKDRVKKAKEIVAELLKMKKLDFEGKSPIDIYTQGQKPKQTENEKVISKPQILKDLRNCLKSPFCGIITAEKLIFYRYDTTKNPVGSPPVSH
ncbi:MAG: ATP-binding protein [Patescibacteria group bacterium]